MLTEPSLVIPATRVFSDETADVWALRVAAVEEWRLDLSVLSPDERRRSETLVRTGDRLAYVAGHILLRDLLSRRLECAPADVAYVREPCPACGGPHGRPAMAGPGRRLQFSISRSREMVLIGIALVPIGVDIEVFPDAGVLAEVSSLLDEDERREIRSAAPSEQGAVFARLWTRKEAYLKGVGTGIATDFVADYVGAGAHPASPSGWTIRTLAIAPGYAAAMAAATRAQ